MHPFAAVREPLVVTFFVPAGLSHAEMQRLIEAWYEALSSYDFVYVGGTSFALNPPCPAPAEARRVFAAAFGAATRVAPLSEVLVSVQQPVAHVLEA